MGFMDRMKDAASQASKATGMGTGMGMGDQVAYRDRMMKLNSEGVDTPATVTSVTETGNSDPGGGKEIEFGVEVRPSSGAPYTTSFKQFMMSGTYDGVAAGTTITLRVDPDDPNSMMFWSM